LALPRCKQHLPNNRTIEARYTAFVLPHGHPNKHVICSESGCNNPAVLWLTEAEQAKFEDGERVFRITESTQILAEKDGQLSN